MTAPWNPNSATADEAGSDAFNRHQLAHRRAMASVRTCAAARAENRSDKLQVLIVDNDPDAADALSALVKCFGHVDRAAYTGADALRVAAVQHPNVVFLDLAMPYLDGCEVARQLRNDFRKSECFIIAISGYTDAALRRKCLEAEIDLVLIKPVDPAVVETLLMLEWGLLRSTKEVGCLA